jgi:hypothetical protein
MFHHVLALGNYVYCSFLILLYMYVIMSLLLQNVILYANFFDNSEISLVNVDVVFFSNFS